MDRLSGRLIVGLALAVIGIVLAASYSRPGPIPVVEYTRVDATSFGTSVSTGWLKVGGFDQLTLEADFVDADTSISRLDWACVTEVSDSAPSGTDGYKLKTLSIISGVGTYSDLIFRMVVSGSESFAINMPLNYRWIRCSFEIGAGSGSTLDTLQIDARASALE